MVNDVEEVVDEAKVAESTSSKNDQAFIDELMSQYNKPAKPVENTVTEETKSDEENPGFSETKKPDSPAVEFTDPEAPFGRYVKGPKKGQPRTKPGAAPKQQVQTQPQQPIEDAQISGMLIDGALFLTLVDLIFPLVISIINNRFSDDKIKPDELQMTREQQKQLTPVCDKVMQQISLSGNPMVILLLGMFSIYGLNFMAAKMNSK